MFKHKIHANNMSLEACPHEDFFLPEGMVGLVLLRPLPWMVVTAEDL